jgi:glycosyltransferase involved in cell wall biosynthesis
MDLSVLIASRNEVWLARTIQDILQNIEGNTEIIVALDGYWPAEPIPDHPRVTIIHFTEPVGQRGAINAGARLSQAKFIMKCDAHCAFDKGFDVKLMADCEYDWTVIPRMMNLHVFDWVCKVCGAKYYQANQVEKCTKCEGTEFGIEEVWKPKDRPVTDFARFDNTMHFQYWQHYGKRPEAKEDIADVMSSVGACFFMHRDRFWELGGLDEKHGFWGQFGTEIACKTWLSGGRQVVNKKTWFSHFFRVGKLKFTYHITGNAQERAREYSRWLWMGNNWEGQRKPLQWLIDKFAPVPTWTT